MNFLIFSELEVKKTTICDAVLIAEEGRKLYAILNMLILSSFHSFPCREFATASKELVESD